MHRDIVSNPEWGTGRVYAILFDLKQDALVKYYPGDPTGAYGDIRRVLTTFGFWNQQGSVYFSSKSDAVTVWRAIDELQNRYEWFAKAVRDLRMLRIEENNDLMPLLRHPELQLPAPSPHPQRDGLGRLN